MPDTSKKSRARLSFDARELHYKFGLHHPMQPKRLEALIDLLETSGLWQPDNEQTRLDGRKVHQK